MLLDAGTTRYATIRITHRVQEWQLERAVELLSFQHEGSDGVPFETVFFSDTVS